MSPEWELVIDPAVGIVLVSGEEAVAQAVRFRLQLLLKEWFLNEDAGCDWMDQVLGDASKTPGMQDRARAIAATAILGAPGVLQILKLETSLDPVTRVLGGTYQARCGFGDTAETAFAVGLAT